MFNCKRKFILGFMMGMVLMFGFTNAGNAALMDRGSGMIYDTELKITWLQNAMGGMRTWDSAMTWAAGLEYGGFTDWRLPTALNQDGTGPCTTTYNCTSSEMGHLFRDLGGQPGQSSIFGSGDPDLALFSNLNQYYYWSSTEFGPDNNKYAAWRFIFNYGYQDIAEKGNTNYIFSMAVRGGDVLAAVPEPATVLLLGLGLAGVAGIRRKLRM